MKQNSAHHGENGQNQNFSKSEISSKKKWAIKPWKDTEET